MLETRDGRGVRADYRCVAASPEQRYVFEQTLEDTPFERFVRRARTEIELSPHDGETEVIRGARPAAAEASPGSDRRMMRRAIGRTLDAALAGLETVATGTGGRA